MSTTVRLPRALAVGATVLLAACGGSSVEKDAGGARTTPASTESPTGRPEPLRNAYFGETHMHTAYSLDAYLGGTRLTPSDAYRFARGRR